MTNPSAHDIFWLARYAHNTLDPLIKAAKHYEPTIQFTIEMIFADEASAHSKASHVNINAHWRRDHPLMFLHEFHVGKEGVELVAAKVQRFIDTEQAALEAADDAKAEEEFLKTLDGNVAGHAEYVEALNSRTPDTETEVSEPHWTEDPAIWSEEQADALADIDWVHQQERRRERADIERDEHDHDIELQNEMAGN